MKNIFSSLFFLIGLSLGFNSSATVIFSGTGTGPDGQPLAASAGFTISGDTLSIVLSNIAPSHASGVQDVPGSTLTGIFFDLTGNPSLTTVSALIPVGSSLIQTATCNPGACAGATNVGGEFSYFFSGAGYSSRGSAHQSIAASGYLQGNASSGNFNGPNLNNPVALGGVDFGLISAAAGFNPNGGLSGVPLIQDSAVFTLTGVAGLTTSNIFNVWFQYGTSLSEASICATCTPPKVSLPEPNMLFLIVLGTAMMIMFRLSVRRF